jgi:hypothetical protein
MPTNQHRPFRALTAALLGSAWMLLLASPVAASPDTDAAEALARDTFYEGVPSEAARDLGAAGVARLIEMLGDPAEAPHHAQILEVLGMSGHPDAYAAVAAAAADEPTGEVDAAGLRKRVAVLAALGHLAREDDRALADLETAARDASVRAPRWRHGRMHGERLSRLMRRSAVSALAISGRREARATLRRLEIEASGDPELERHVRSARIEHARMQRRATGQSPRRGRGVER